ncbi:hypothetical protein DB345_09210 [Spartobacteria bacterium LR76]|nr:hypothetical protein DB345_09210 [Spartobacteria bacterium LR76]
MKVHLHQIPQGGTLLIEGEEDASFLGLEEADARALSPVRYALDVGLSDGGLFATGWVEVEVELRCVACLETYPTKVRIDPFALQKELDGRELVDLTEEIREDIHLALPSYPRCDAEGERACPASFPRASATESSGAVAWDALDKLKNKD